MKGMAVGLQDKSGKTTHVTAVTPTVIAVDLSITRWPGKALLLK